MHGNFVTVSMVRGQRRRGLGFILWGLLAAGFAVSGVASGAPSYFYGINDAAELWVMGLGGPTPTQQKLLTTSLTPVVNGLAYDRSREQLFIVDGNNDFYWWQQGASDFTKLASGTALGISGSTSATQPWGAAYYDNAYWFFEGNELLGTNVLRKVSLTYSGSNTPTGVSYADFTAPDVTLPNSFGDIAITTSGTLYAYKYKVPGDFYSLDLNTISSGTVGGYNLISTTSGTGLQIALTTDSATLYGHNFDDGSWYTVDMGVGTLSAVPSFTTSSFRDIAGSSLQAVPEPSSIVLAMLGGGMVAWQFLRRRKPARRPAETLPDGEDEAFDSEPVT